MAPDDEHEHAAVVVADEEAIDDNDLQELSCDDAEPQADQEISIYCTASHDILLHFCQRLDRLEGIVTSVQAEMVQTKNDVARETSDMQQSVADMQRQVQLLASQLGDVANVVDLFQQEMHTQRSSITSLSTTLSEEHRRIDEVAEKVDTQHDAFDARMNELQRHLEELPNALLALQGNTTTEHPAPPAFTFRRDDDKLSMRKHMQNVEVGRGASRGPFTDLQAFEIPDEMKERVEQRIREHTESAIEADRNSAIELADAYRRLQLAGYPRVTEMHMQISQCQADLARAFELIRTSNLQLYACCQAKAERSDLSAIAQELGILRDHVRKLDSDMCRGFRQHPGATIEDGALSLVPAEVERVTAMLRIWNLDKFFGSSMDQTRPLRVHLTTAQVPVLRVALLELSRDLNALRQEWIQKTRHPLDPLVKHHMERVVALLNAAYASTAEEPVDLPRVCEVVEKIAVALGSQFSREILTMMARARQSPSDNDAAIAPTDSASSRDLVAMLTEYSQAMSSVVIGDRGDNELAHKHKHQLELMRTELSLVLGRQSKLEAALDKVSDKVSEVQEDLTKRAMATTTSTAMATATSTTIQANELHPVLDQVSALRDQLLSMQREVVSIDAFRELFQLVDQMRKQQDQMPIAGIMGQRMSGGPSSFSSSFRQRAGASHLESDAAAPTDRPKSRTRLNPLTIHRVDRDARANSMASAASPMRNGMLHKIPRAQDSTRPTSGSLSGKRNNG